MSKSDTPEELSNNVDAIDSIAIENEYTLLSCEEEELLKYLQELENTSTPMPATDDLTEILKEKRLLMLTFGQQAAENISNAPPTIDFLLYRLHRKLHNTEKTMRETLMSNRKFLAEENKKLLRLKKLRLETIQFRKKVEDEINNVTKRKDNPNKTAVTLENKIHKLDEVFLNHKKLLHQAIKTLFPGGSMKELIRKLYSAYFTTGTHNYIEFDEADFPNVEYLKRAYIVQKHPTDPRKIKLTNFV